MRKLSNCNSNTAEMQLRNEFLYRLLQQTHQGELRAPFDEVPPNTPLLQLRHMLVSYKFTKNIGKHGNNNKCQCNCFCSKPLEEEPELTDTARWAERVMGRRPRPVLYSQSPDGGAFIASQPIPSCGVFCYMAVVSTKNKK